MYLQVLFYFFCYILSASPELIIPYPYPLFKQCDPAWGNNTIVTTTICAVGCLLSSTAMALNGHNIPINTSAVANPGTLNYWLQQNNGYDSTNDFEEGALNLLNPSHVQWNESGGMHRTRDVDLSIVQQLLLNHEPVILNVDKGRHFVLAIGWVSTNNDTILVNDPGFERTNYSYTNDVVGLRLFNMTDVTKPFITDMNRGTSVRNIGFENSFTRKVANSPSCSMGPSTWLGGSVPITVSAETSDGAFTASAQGAWQNAPGKHFVNGTVFLLDGAPGIYGMLNSKCDQIDWNDGAGSIWTRPPPLVPYNATISNIIPRRDDTGEIMRIQDGCLQRFNDVWYLYGARYQCCPVSEQPACYSPCGWTNSTYAVYSSPDLETWHLENDNLLPIATDPDSPHYNLHTAYFEPCVLYSKSADHYVLWFLTTNTKAVAVSDSPIGPFESVSWNVGLAEGSDSYFWQDADDPDGTYYVKHNGPPPAGETRGAHYVSQLSPDLLSLVPNATSPAMMVPALPVPPEYQGNWPSCSEGGGIFKHDNFWYVQAAVCCCFCAAGANAFVWISTTGPLGTYTLQNSSSSGLLGNVIPFNTTTGKYLTGSQQFSVAQITLYNGERLPVYVGQRFGSADDGLKCHDYQYYAPIEFLPDGTVDEMKWVNSFTIEIGITSSDE
jgi:hypothetical protein